MKAIIIENETEIPKELRFFVEQNNTLFESVDEQVMCIHRDIRDVARFILKADAVIIMSTFIYKSQLERYVEEFTIGSFAYKNFTFFIYEPLMQFNYWLKNGGSFEQTGYFLSNLITLIKTHKVYSIEKITENNSYIYKRIEYNNSINQFELV